MRKIRIVVKRNEDGTYTLKKFANRTLVAARTDDSEIESRRPGELTAEQYEACVTLMQLSDADSLEMRFIETR